MGTNTNYKNSGIANRLSLNIQEFLSGPKPWYWSQILNCNYRNVFSEQLIRAINFLLINSYPGINNTIQYIGQYVDDNKKRC